MIVSWDIIMILAPAFVAGALISLAHVPLGIEVLKRGIIFLDLAVAQCAALGMLAFHVAFDHENIDPYIISFGTLLSGLIAALTCAIAFQRLEKHAGQYQEALIGCTFILAASLSVLVISGDPHSGEQMKDILAGQILWVSWSDLFWAAPVFVFTALVWAFLKQHRARLFYLLFALTIPFSVNLIGVYLVFASLIIPALATLSVQSNRGVITFLISILSFILGLTLSYILDAPSGPLITITMAIIAPFTSYFLKITRHH